MYEYVRHTANMVTFYYDGKRILTTTMTADEIDELDYMTQADLKTLVNGLV